MKGSDFGDELFRYTTDRGHSLLVQAATPELAEGKLTTYLNSHPQLPPWLDWRMVQILGHVGPGIYSLMGV